MNNRVRLEIINPEPHKELAVGSEILVSIINPSTSLVLDTPPDIQSINVNNEFNMYVVNNKLEPVPMRVKAKEFTIIPEKLLPLSFLKFRVIVTQEVPLPKDFTSYTLVMRLFDEY